MPLIGGKNAKKKPSSSSTKSKRHFTVVIGNKEHGLYVSSSPSSAARKAVSKLCATDKKKKVQFSIREITQGSKKKTYGPYLGEIEKLAKPIELKGRIIKYKPVAKLIGKKTKTGGALAKKKGYVLVVESKDGIITEKYITKKQADKHMKQRHKRLDKGMKPLHKSMDKSMKKLHKSMRGGAEHSLAEHIICKSIDEGGPGDEYIIDLKRETKDGPIIMTLTYTGVNKNPVKQECTYSDTLLYDIKDFDDLTKSMNEETKLMHDWIITFNQYRQSVSIEKNLKLFLQKYTDSMGDENNFQEILKEINSGL